MTNKVLPWRFLPIIAVMLTAITTTPVLASPITATRTLPASVTSGAEFNVTIETSGCGAFGQVVENLPSDFTYVDCASDGIRVKQVGNAVKFTFLEDSASFTYRVKAPNIAATTTYTFHGVVKDEDRNEYPIEDDDITVTVTGPVTYVLTMAADGDTHSTTPSVGNHMYDDGDVVNISATAGAGWQFDNWDGDVASPSSSSTTVTMDADKIVIANFAEIPPGVYVLTVTCKPSEAGNVILSPSKENNQYEEGTSVELIVAPAEGYVSSFWGGDLSGSTNPITIIMDSNKSVIANFVLSASERPASFAASPLNISPEQVQPNQQVDISINITNNGEESGNYEAVLYLNGQLEDSRIVIIPPGSSQNVAFSITKATPGTYSVSLGEQQGQFAVVGSQSTGAGLGTGTTIAIVIMAALIAALVFVFRRIKKRA